jgi:site-specific recombinase XerD
MARKLNRATVSTKLEATASSPMGVAWLDFILSRRTICSSEVTIKWYKETAGQFVCWLADRGIDDPLEIKAIHVRMYLDEFKVGGASEQYVHNHARAVRTLVRFLHEEKYIPEPIKFKMPPLSKQRLPYLKADEVTKVLEHCQNPRDKAIILLMVDTGIRRAELVNLNWGDIDLKSGVVNIARGKGGKSRSVVIGSATRRAIMAYARTINQKSDAPLIQTKNGTRMQLSGLRSMLERLSKRCGIHIAPHALRRTFATLALRAGMSPLHLPGLLGHSTLDMTRRYVQMVDDDLVEAHRLHGPVDHALKK